MGRLLGPQLMVAGGGHPTHQWFGMYYAGQAGRRLPVPIFQAAEDFAVYLVLIAIERRLDRWPDGTRRVGYPPGIVLGTGMVLWGIERSLDEHLWLGEDGRLGSDLVQLAGVLLVIGGIVILVRTRTRWRDWLLTHHAPDSRRRDGGRRPTGLSARRAGAGYSSRRCASRRSRTRSACRSMACAPPFPKIHPTSHQGRISGRSSARSGRARVSPVLVPSSSSTS